MSDNETVPASTQVGFLETAALVVSVCSMPSMPSECSPTICRRVSLSMPTTKLPARKINSETVWAQKTIAQRDKRDALFELQNFAATGSTENILLAPK